MTGRAKCPLLCVENISIGVCVMSASFHSQQRSAAASVTELFLSTRWRFNNAVEQCCTSRPLCCAPISAYSALYTAVVSFNAASLFKLLCGCKEQGIHWFSGLAERCEAVVRQSKQVHLLWRAGIGSEPGLREGFLHGLNEQGCTGACPTAQVHTNQSACLYEMVFILERVAAFNCLFYLMSSMR